MTAERIPMPTRHLAHLLMATLLTLFASSFAQAAEQPVKSPNDPNSYRYLELDNGLKVILVSDPQAEKAAASLNVAVGSGDDPDERAGLAHFLEHMLFLGTEKYPEPGEYQQFIRSHGGSHNAFTAFQDTNFFFDVESEFLEPALDRFAQQFSAPLFTAELVDRERHAVHSEYTSKLKDDGRRLLSVRKAAGNPDHAFSRFAVGNLTTLENTEDNPLRPDLVEFWQQHYSSNIMSLAVYGPQPLDTLEAMVTSRFGEVENRNLKPTQHSQPFFVSDNLPEKILAQTLKDTRHMTLAFPIPSQQDNYRSKPASYLASILGHEGPGSLLDVLKRAGLVEGLSAGLGRDTGENATLEISMSLTREGMARQDDILELAFAYIDKIRQDGISPQRFEEMQQLARMEFRFHERGEPVNEVTRLSRMLREYPAEDVLQAPWLMETYAPEQYRNILARLTPDNVKVWISGPDLDLKDPKLTEWYQTSWQRQPLKLANKPDTTLAGQLALPPANPFIPEDLSLVAGNTMEQPEHLTSVDGLDVWYARDTRFDTPRANVFVSLRTPATGESARSDVLSSLLVDAINTNLNAQAYAARVAGLNYRIYSHLRGITIRVGGYSDKLHTLLARILTEVARPGITEQRFQIARQRLIDGLENQERERPVSQTSRFIQTALLEGTFPVKERLAAARDVTRDELEAFARSLLDETDPVMLAHGNLTEASALNLANQVRALVLQQGQRTDVPRSVVRQIPEGQTLAALAVDHPDTGYTLYLQGRDRSYEERARFRVLNQILSSPFYEEIRTNRQLGYLVYATNFEMLETPALALVVQSPKADAQVIDSAVSEFTDQFAGQLASLDTQRLEREKQAVISSLLEKERQLDEISGRYWREIDRSNHDFDSRQKLADAVRAVTRQDLIETYQRTLEDRQRGLMVVTGRDEANADEALRSLRQQPPVPQGND